MDPDPHHLATDPKHCLEWNNRRKSQQNAAEDKMHRFHCTTKKTKGRKLESLSHGQEFSATERIWLLIGYTHKFNNLSGPGELIDSFFDMEFNSLVVVEIYGI